MHKQRIWIAAIAGFGLLTPFLPWINVMGLIGVSGTEVAQGWVVAVIFAAAIVVAVTGNRAYGLDASRRGVLAVLGTAAAGFGAWKLVEIRKGTVDVAGEIGQRMKQQAGPEAGELGQELGRGMMSMFGDSLFETGFGVYAVIATGVVLVIAAAVFKRAAA